MTSLSFSSLNFYFVFIMLVSVTCIAWFSEDRPFAVGYFDGKLLLGTKEPLEKGGIVLIDAHKVKHLYQMITFSYFILQYCLILVSQKMFFTSVTCDLIFCCYTKFLDHVYKWRSLCKKAIELRDKTETVKQDTLVRVPPSNARNTIYEE